MSRKIPTAVIAEASDALANKYSHAAIDQMMEAAGIELEPSPPGNKQVKSRAWLNHANRTCADPLITLGQVITEMMEADNERSDSSQIDVQKVHQKPYE
jgi:predicted nucleotide-binding protein (sugar kinase/HSP70/actin superfamily)